ncbi:SRPBCC family protein [Galactobacter sp.]|uniref:SRPBCC family protein n=1 Tax=Galactobacter sp. TaxID=2676125 RepID=UPI0025BB9D59|nr:SRPBCC family protein [Galactobacter sp.]
MPIWSRTQTRYLAASPESVWDVLSTPGLWPAFDDDIQTFTPVDTPALVGPEGPRTLRRGERVKVVPRARVRGMVHGLTAPPAILTSVVTDQELTWFQKQPGGGTTQTWQLTPEGKGTLLTRSVKVEGPLAPVLGPAFGEALSHDLGAVVARLSHMVTMPPDAARLPLVVIAGGSGQLGQKLAHALMARGRRVVVLTRHMNTRAAYPQIEWDGATTAGDWTRVFRDGAGVDVVNLCGSRIGAKGPQAAATLVSSRINPTRVLVRAAQESGARVAHWVQASGLVPQTDADSPAVTESSVVDPWGEAVPGMTDLVHRWEDAAADAPTDHLVYLRTGTVLDREFEAFRALAALATTGAGGATAGGKQWVPWIHVEDWLRLALSGLDAEPGARLPSGPVVAAAPFPVMNRELMRSLRTKLAPGGLGLPIPAGLLKLGAGLLRKDAGLLIGSTLPASAVVPVSGFAFTHPRLDSALDDLLN